MVIVGINPGYDSTAAVLVDGTVAAVVEEERLSRVKNHLGFPRRAIPEALRVAGVQPRDVDLVTFSFVQYLNANSLITELLLSENGVTIDPENPLRLIELMKETLKVAKIKDIFSLSFKKASKSNYASNQRRYIEALRELDMRIDSMLPIDHHLSHAASAYYGSGFEECLIVTSDGCGDGLSGSVSVGKNGKIHRIRKTPEMFSAGLFYGAITSYLGFKAHRHEGKITGLAAYGNPESCYEELVPCLTLDRQSHLTCEIIDPSVQNRLRHLVKIFGNDFYRNPVVNDYHDYFERSLRHFSREDIAAAAQKRLEDVFIGYLAPIIEETGLKNVALAGRVFANVKLNQRIFEIAGVEAIHVHPNMGDGGNALGSALIGKRKHQGNGSSYFPERMDHVYLGPEYSDREIEAELERSRFRYKRHEDIETLIGNKVAGGEIVGRFNARMEYGPRALGNRSILAHPGQRDINKVLNERLHRTEFMPFAPSVLAEDAQKYFEISAGNGYPAEFMTITCNVRNEQRNRIPAVTHVDGTARPHLVRASVNPSYHTIISAFKRKTGLGAIVNTSFNIHEEPIICSPADACRALGKNAVDCLAIGNYLVER